jgi:hypothetical protein
MTSTAENENEPMMVPPSLRSSSLPPSMDDDDHLPMTNRVGAEDDSRIPPLRATEHPMQTKEEKVQQEKENVPQQSTFHDQTFENSDLAGIGGITQKRRMSNRLSMIQAAITTMGNNYNGEEHVGLQRIISMEPMGTEPDEWVGSDGCHSNSASSSLPTTVTSKGIHAGGHNRQSSLPTILTHSGMEGKKAATTAIETEPSESQAEDEENIQKPGRATTRISVLVGPVAGESADDGKVQLLEAQRQVSSRTIVEPDEWVGSDGCHPSSKTSGLAVTDSRTATVTTGVMHTDRSGGAAMFKTGRPSQIGAPVKNPNLKPAQRRSSTMEKTTTRRSSTTIAAGRRSTHSSSRASLGSGGGYPHRHAKRDRGVDTGEEEEVEFHCDTVGPKEQDEENEEFYNEQGQQGVAASQPGAIRVNSMIPNSTMNMNRPISTMIMDDSTVLSNTHHHLPQADVLHEDDEIRDIEQQSVMVVEGYNAPPARVHSFPIVLKAEEVHLEKQSDNGNNAPAAIWCGLPRIWAVVVLIMLMACVLLGSTLGAVLSRQNQSGAVIAASSINNNTTTAANNNDNTNTGVDGTVAPQGSSVPNDTNNTTMFPSLSPDSGTIVTPAPTEPSPIDETPTPSPSLVSSSPSTNPSSSPSMAPTIISATPEPTDSTPAPIPASTPAPVVPVSTPAPVVPAPTQPPVLSPGASCNSIETTRSCYVRSSMTQITVNFANCEPQFDDWIGIFPSEEASDYLLNDQLWVYACGGQTCKVAASEGTVNIDHEDFDDSSATLSPTDPNDGSYLSFPIPAGTYRVHLMRDSENGPWVAHASSAVFEISDNGCR